jgi:hypothetical protein
MSLDYKEVANVLDAVADYIDDIEFAKSAAEKAAKEERIGKFASKYETSTGEALPASLKEKLASLDPEALDHLLKVAKNTEDSPESLGEPSDHGMAVLPRTTKEAAAQADDNFLNWIVS